MFHMYMMDFYLEILPNKINTIRFRRTKPYRSRFKLQSEDVYNNNLERQRITSCI